MAMLFPPRGLSPAGSTMDRPCLGMRAHSPPVRSTLMPTAAAKSSSSMVDLRSKSITAPTATLAAPLRAFPPPASSAGLGNHGYLSPQPAWSSTSQANARGSMTPLAPRTAARGSTTPFAPKLGSGSMSPLTPQAFNSRSSISAPSTSKLQATVAGSTLVPPLGGRASVPTEPPQLMRPVSVTASSSSLVVPPALSSSVAAPSMSRSVVVPPASAFSVAAPPVLSSVTVPTARPLLSSVTIVAASSSVSVPSVSTRPAGTVTTAMGSPILAAANGSADKQLKAGAVLQLQGALYDVVGPEPLGMGSFGAVWEAERRDGVEGKVAIKEILCRSQKELADAMLEGRLLSMIHGAKPQQLDGKVPDLVAMETEVIQYNGKDCWLMRLAMTKVPGMQLDTFLDICKGKVPCNDEAVLNVADDVMMECQTLSGACKFARSLLFQMVCTFECMSTVVYHRDVSPHNILIDVSDPRNLSFGLVDFGLSIDRQSWHGPKGNTSWHYVDIGGDCRYWPVSVWIMFIGGSDELERQLPLSQEYQTRLDFHALGITVLEILMSLLPPTALATDEMWALQAAWEQYWQNVTDFWKRTMAVFDSGEDPARLKHWIRNDGRVLETIGSDLAVLRTALKKAADSCAKPGHVNSSPDAARLFRTLLALVGRCGTVGVQDSNQPPSWQSVKLLVDSPVGTVSNEQPHAATSPFLGHAGSVAAPATPGTPFAPRPFPGSVSLAAPATPASPFAPRPVSGSVALPSGCRIADMTRAGSPLILQSRATAPPPSYFVRSSLQTGLRPVR